ncbi:sensor histidine kinase [Pseudomonas sp. MS19]|uniref:HAMP domain-containing sensor histidine kinase n=1 Tax=Pseudomonas sp. MS19 TaxID=2579939 RepID=UPI0015626837|nr:sensor histidine kinase [Pseudomonas sp. MS19]NRH28949.1 HAMP domain-containing protein [Pseudomonas sp. MS19]
MARTYPLFWRLAALQLGVCILIAWGAWYWAGKVEQSRSFLEPMAKRQMHAYARQAERAWLQGGSDGVEHWLERMAKREPGVWLVVVDNKWRSLTRHKLDAEDYVRLRRVRGLDNPMSKRARGQLYIGMPFVHAPQQGQLVMQLPQRFLPEGFTWSTQILLHGVAPGVLALLLCLFIYRLLISPLGHLRDQANALRGDQLATRVSPRVSQRRDELGDLGRAFDHMAERLQKTIAFQRQLLRDVSHELRTPLSRLRVASESQTELDTLRQRVDREVLSMQQLVDATLELAWLDTEQPRLALEPIDIGALWSVLCEDACFESGWQPQQLRCDLPYGCRVLGHLNSLAQALENILRNAIRHSPAGGLVTLSGKREADTWLLQIEDQGGGIAESELENIFRPFTRLSAARPGGEGYGLGLAIAKGALKLQDASIWAENTGQGLRLCVRLQTV